MSGSAAVGPRPQTVALPREGPHRTVRLTAPAPRPRDPAAGRTGLGGAAEHAPPRGDEDGGGGRCVGVTGDGTGWGSGGGPY